MVEAYWNIGKTIVLEAQNGNQKADYGKEIISVISTELTVEFGKGFSERNIRNFRQFYLAFPETEIWQTLSAKLIWSHFQLIMSVSSKEAQKRRTHGSGHTLQQFCQKKAKFPPAGRQGFPLLSLTQN